MLQLHVCIPRSFLVINVCNHGKTLCSTCRSLTDETYYLRAACALFGFILFADGYYYEVPGLQRYGAVYIGMRYLDFEGTN